MRYNYFIKKARNVMMKELNNNLQQAFKEYGFNRLDKSDQTTVLKMLKDREDYKKNQQITYSSNLGYLATNHSQNFLLLKQLLNLQEQNQQIIEQNNKVIELLEKLNNK